MRMSDVLTLSRSSSGRAALCSEESLSVEVLCNRLQSAQFASVLLLFNRQAVQCEKYTGKVRKTKPCEIWSTRSERFLPAGLLKRRTKVPDSLRKSHLETEALFNSNVGHFY